MNLKILFLSILCCSCHLAISQGFSVEKLPFSKKHQSEIAPTVHDSVLYFSSNKNIRWLVKATDLENQNFYNLFKVQQNVDSTWSEEKLFQRGYFSKHHTTSISFFAKRNEIYFTEMHVKDKKQLNKNKKSKNEEANKLLGVYVANKKGDSYGRARSMPFNSRRSYHTAYPSISADGRYLFFASDMEGGYGRADLYVSERINGVWSEPLNLGSNVNTTGSEVFPFYHESGKLYFASDSLGGQGGYDIFYTYRTDDGWAQPVALQEGINTPANEFSCYIDPSEQHGYFASDRYGDDDLFEFTHWFPVFGPATKQKENTFKYRFYDRMNGKGDGPLKYRWSFGDGSTAEGDTVIHQYKSTGTYHVQSVLVDTLENVELFVLNDFEQNVQEKIQVYINVPDEVKVGELQTLDASKTNPGDITPNGYYWELPDGTKKKGETIQYIFRTKGKHIIKCGTICKTDPNKKMCTYKEINVIE